MALDKSLARGAARFALGNANDAMNDRAAEGKARGDDASVTDAASAKRLFDRWCEYFSGRVVMIKAEFAGKHSELCGVFLETMKIGDELQLWAQRISSSGGRSGGGPQGLRISLHANERFLQRTSNVVLDIAALTDEYSPALLLQGSTAMDSRSPNALDEVLLPTLSGALLASLDTAQELPYYVAKTWIREAQMRADQRRERDAHLAECVALIERARRPMKRAGRYAGRRDTVKVFFNSALEQYVFAWQAANRARA
jgi:hypothetical protein